MTIARAERLNPDQLKDTYVTGPDNQLVPLSAMGAARLARALPGRAFAKRGAASDGSALIRYWGHVCFQGFEFGREMISREFVG